MRDKVKHKSSLSIFLGRTFLAVLVVGLAQPAAASWLHSGGTTSGRSFVSGQGDISDAVDKRPGTAAVVQAPASDFQVSRFADIDGDGTDEILRVYQSRVGAFDLGNGSLRWSTPALGITSIVDVADMDGDGSEDEVVAVGSNLGGGIYIIDLETGALEGSFSDLQGNSGVRVSELALVDVDADGGMELVFGASLLVVSDFYLVDFSTSDGTPRSVRSELQGYYNLYNRLAVGDFDGDGLEDEIVTLQAAALDLKTVCDPGRPGAVCDDVDGTLCLCDQALIEDAFAAQAFPQRIESLDTSGDGKAELVLSYWHGSHGNGFGAIDLSSYFDGSPAPQVAGWLYDYSAATGRPRPYVARGEFQDWNGDGNPDFVVTLGGPTDDEVGITGSPSDDGLDHSGGLGFGVYDGATGDALATLVDAVAHGYADLDGDGADEIVVERALDGGLAAVEGYRLSCDTEGCQLVQAWSLPTHRLTRRPEDVSPTQVPSLRVPRVGGLEEGANALVLWVDSDLQHVGLDDDGEPLLGKLASLGEEDQLAGLKDEGDAVLVNRSGQVTVYSGALEPRAKWGQLPSGEVLRWLAGPILPNLSGDVSFLGGDVFYSLSGPASLSSAEGSFGDEIVLIADVDSNGVVDFFAVEESVLFGGFAIRRVEHNPALDDFVVHWTWESGAPESPTEGMGFRTFWSFNHGDFNGDGVDDLVFSMERYPNMELVVIDGASGDLSQSSSMTFRDLQWGAMLVEDLCSTTEYGVSDGQLDVLRPSRLKLEAWTPGEPSASSVLNNGLQHSNFAFGDLDGDGADDLLMGRFFPVPDPALEAVSIDGELATLWGPQLDLLSPPGGEQAMALAELDDQPGLDVLVPSSSGGLDLRSGFDGARVPGFPVWLARGEQLVSPNSQTLQLTAVLAMDVDGDARVEAIVGGADGYVYAVDVHRDEEEPGSLLWSWFGGGAPVGLLAGGDVDHDGALEVLVSLADGTARVVDGLGTSIEITQPGKDDCLETTLLEVCGVSNAIEQLDLLVQGLPRAQGVQVENDGTWCVEVEVPAVAATVELVAVGWLDGSPVASDQYFISSNVDADSDGVTVCGGDCDDDNADIAPGLPEACDGLDNDCDPTTDEYADVDGDGVSACDGDCDDSQATVFPGATEDCEDGRDNDCDERTDEADENCSSDVPIAADPTCSDCSCSTLESAAGKEENNLPLPVLLLSLVSACWVRRRQRRGA